MNLHDSILHILFHARTIDSTYVRCGSYESEIPSTFFWALSRKNLARDASSPLCQFFYTEKGKKWVIYPERAQGVTVTESSFVIPLPPRKLDPPYSSPHSHGYTRPKGRKGHFFKIPWVHSSSPTKRKKGSVQSPFSQTDSPIRALAD